MSGLVERLRATPRCQCAGSIDEFLNGKITDEAADEITRLTARVAELEGDRHFPLGTRVTKIRGSSWTGLVVGYYSTSLNPDGICVESENEPGSVQVYPAAALRALADGGEEG